MAQKRHGQWRKERNGTLTFAPVETTSRAKLTDRVAISADPMSGTVHVVLIGKFGDATTLTVRPTDARRIGVALVEAGILASEDSA